MIRVALGEVSYVGYANPDNFSYPEIMIAVLSTMLAEWRPGPDETSEEARGTANGSRTLPSGGLARPKRAGQLPDRPTQWRAGWLE